MRSPRLRVNCWFTFQSSCAKKEKLLVRYSWLNTPPPPKLKSTAAGQNFLEVSEPTDAVSARGSVGATPAVFTKNNWPLKTCGKSLSRLTRVYSPPKRKVCLPFTQLSVSTKLKLF